MSRFLHSSSLIPGLTLHLPFNRSVFAARTLSSISAVYKNDFDSSRQLRNINQKTRLNFSSKHLTPAASAHSIISSFHTSKIFESSGSEGESSKYAAEGAREQVSHESYDNEEYTDRQSEQTTNHQADSQSQSSEYTPPRGGGGESVIDRLRRLSMTPAEEYELSPMAQAKAREMAKVRAEVRSRGEEWKWDQRNIRPSGPGPQQHRQRSFQMRNWDENDDDDYSMSRSRGQRNFRMRRWEDEEEDDGYHGGRQPRYDRQDEFQDRETGYRRPRPSRNEYGEEDGPLDYEKEMQKLRERMEQIKAKKTERAISTKQAVAAEGDEFGTSERSSESSKLSNPAYNSLRHSSNKLEESWHTDHEAQTKSVGQFRHNEKDDQLQHYKNKSNNNTSEEELSLSFAGEDPDTFGTLMTGSTIVKDTVAKEMQKQLNEEAKELALADEEEEDDARFYPRNSEKWTTPKLIAKVRELLKEKKLKEAVDTFVGAISEGGFPFNPNEFRHHYNVLIHECARVGYVEMAFRLYYLMKSQGHKDDAKTVTSLLNACANSPWAKEENMDRIEKLLINLKEKDRYLNIIGYSALVKAYGRLGEIVLAFGAVDQMIQEGRFQPDTHTFNMLLQACITDKKNGFRHALITWKKMQSMRISPDIYSYNLMLNAIYACGIEIQELKKESTKMYISSDTDTIPALPPMVSEEESSRLSNYLVVENPSDEQSELTLSQLGEPTILDVKSLRRALAYPENRLAVLGGIRGVLSHMVRNKVSPNLKTLTLFAQCASSDGIIDVLRLLKAYKIKGDAFFYTRAIKRCFDLWDDKSAKEVIKMMNFDNVTPDVDTYAALAMGCRSIDQAKDFLKEMDDSNCKPDLKVMMSLQEIAFKSYQPMYYLYVMEETRRRKLVLNEGFLKNCEKFYEDCQRGLVSKEMGKQVVPNILAKEIEHPRFAEQFAIFKMRYNTWAKQVDIEIEPTNPWKGEYEYYKKHRQHKPAGGEILAIDLESEKVSANTSA